jgi:isoleucyl-tRNA synthetase
VLTAEDVTVQPCDLGEFAVEADGSTMIFLDCSLSDELRDEGFAREIVNKVQNMRKTSGFEVTDTIRVRIRSSERLRQAAARHGEFIQHETLARSLEFVSGDDLTEPKEWDINGEKAAIEVVKT